MFFVSSKPQVGREIKAVLKQHQETTIVHDEDPALCIAVRRRHIWKDAKLALLRGNNVYSRGMSVTFVSEAAVDEGGPTREFFRLVLADVARNNSLFDGSLERRVVKHNLLELRGNSYLIVGRLIALSLMYGGPSPQFFARPVAEYLLGASPTATVEDVPDKTVRADLIRVCIFYVTKPVCL